MEYEIQKYINGDIEIDVKASHLENTVWLSKDQMATLFNRDRTVISKHIKNICSSNEEKEESNVHFLHIANSDRDTSIRFLHRSTQNAPSYRRQEHYNLDVILFVGKKVKYKELQPFANWVRELLKYKEYRQKEPNIIVFNDKNLYLDVKIMPEENTVYLTKEQMSLLFGRSVSVISRHVNNIFKEGELDKRSSFAKNANEVNGQTYYTEYATQQSKQYG